MFPIFSMENLSFHWVHSKGEIPFVNFSTFIVDFFMGCKRGSEDDEESSELPNASNLLPARSFVLISQSKELPSASKLLPTASSELPPRQLFTSTW